jgi:hypothetical protein
MMEEKRIDELASAVARLERKIDFLLKTLNLQYQETSFPFQSELETLVRRSNRVDAIKLLRQRLDLTFLQAEAIIEQIEKQQNEPPSQSGLS